MVSISDMTVLEVSITIQEHGGAKRDFLVVGDDKDKKLASLWEEAELNDTARTHAQMHARGSHAQMVLDGA